jgi:exonuclease III
VALIEIKKYKLILASIYGPNSHNPYFFQALYRAIKEMGDYPVIMGGDFNATFSMDPVALNIDCHSMNEIPNYRHSKYINDFSEALNLVDPFRFLHPNKREYSYKPFGNKRKNRSRIDFFLVSVSLLNLKIDCSINSSILASCFDHKPILLNFLAEDGEKNVRSKNYVFSRAPFGIRT